MEFPCVTRALISACSIAGPFCEFVVARVKAWRVIGRSPLSRVSLNELNR